MKVIQICVLVLPGQNSLMVFRHVKVIQICVVVTTRSEFSGGFQTHKGGQDLYSDYYQVRSLVVFRHM